MRLMIYLDHDATTPILPEVLVLNYCMALEKTPLLAREGVGGGPYRVTYLPVDRQGLLKLADLEAAITDQTALVSLMWANNETGVFFPVEQIAEICRSRGALYHCDAVQAAGKVAIDVRKVQADYLSLTGHKFHVPRRIGALRACRGLLVRAGRPNRYSNICPVARGKLIHVGTIWNERAVGNPLTGMSLLFY
jgi:hypothetical protein